MMRAVQAQHWTTVRRSGGAPTDRRGFTMIELAIAITLAALIVAGLYQLFIAQSRQLQFLDMQAEMNQNLRFATDILTRTIRQAGLGTAQGTAGPLGNTSDSELLNPILGTAGADAPDAITVVHQDPSLILNTSTMFTLPGDTDYLPFDLSLTAYRHSAKLGQYAAGEFLLCSDFANPQGMASFLWEIESVDLSASDYGYIHVGSNSAYPDYTAIMPSTQNLPPVMTCSKGEVVTFYIDQDADGVGPGSAEHPVLMMDLDYDWPEADDVPLVDDIEDLQIRYCMADTTGMLPCTDAGAWFDTLPTTSWPWMVRVAVMARSRREEATESFTNRRPELLDHIQATTDDHYYRQVVQTDVTLRNMRFYSNVFGG